MSNDLPKAVIQAARRVCADADSGESASVSVDVLRWLPRDVPTPKITEYVREAVLPISKSPRLMALISENWGYLETLAAADRYLGQAGVPPTKGIQNAFKGLEEFLEWAGADGRFAKGLAPYAAARLHSKSSKVESQIAADVEAVRRLAAILHGHISGTNGSKREKAFPGALAALIIDWYELLKLGKPSQYEHSPAIKLMETISSAHGRIVSASVHANALRAELKRRS